MSSPASTNDSLRAGCHRVERRCRILCGRSLPSATQGCFQARENEVNVVLVCEFAVVSIATKYSTFSTTRVAEIFETGLSGESRRRQEDQRCNEKMIVK